MPTFQKSLRDYQEDAGNAAINGFRYKVDDDEGGPFTKQLLVEPTGSGKTVIFASLANYVHDYCDPNAVFEDDKVFCSNKSLVLVDQIDLADQARMEILESTGLYAQIEQGTRTATDQAPIVIASVQTMANRLDKFAPNEFGLVICDEADRSVSEQWQKVLKHFDPHAKIVGVTATPDRGDQKNVLDYYERIAHETKLFDLIKQGYLAKIMVQTCPLSIDISKVKQTAGDYDKEELDAALTPYFAEVCENILKFAPNRKILAFLPLIETSVKFKNIAVEHGIKAEHIDGEDGADSREFKKRQFRSGEIQLLSNAMLLGRGYNDPSIDCIVNLRPTRSAPLYRQFVGRGTRCYCPHGCHERCEHDDAKKDLLLLDFIWQFHRLGLQRPANLVATSDEHARKLTDYSVRQSGRLLDLEGIDSKVALEAEKLLLRSLQKAALKARPGFVDAMEFAVYAHQRELVDYEARSKWELRPVSEKQSSFLAKIGVDPLTVKNFGQAHMILNEYQARRAKNLATAKQVKALRSYGIPKPELVTFEGAKALLDWHISRNPMPEGVKVYTDGADVVLDHLSNIPTVPVDDDEPPIIIDGEVVEPIRGMVDAPMPESFVDEVPVAPKKLIPKPTKPRGDSKFASQFAEMREAVANAKPIEPHVKPVQPDLL